VSLFDSYLVVDWSAAGRRRQGLDSIWLALARPVEACQLWNPPTRHEAEGLLAELLEGERTAGRRVLAGFDFPFGYPRGAARLLTGRNGWSALWEALGREVVEGADNANNRFDAAARLNAGVAGGGPFWGNGLARDIEGLPRRCPTGWGASLPARRRLIERNVRGAQETWKLTGVGSVGGQALVGIAALDRLRRRDALAGSIAVWPFEPIFGRAIVFAEIYPSLWPPDPRESVKDAGQVRAVAEHFRALDAAGRMAALLSVPEELEADDRDAVLAEEAWMLGADREGRPAVMQPVTWAEAPDGVDNADGAGAAYGVAEPGRKGAGAAGPDGAALLQYLRDPAEIYRRSFAAVRAEARLDHLPGELQDVAVRLVHACGMPEITARLAWSEDLARAAGAALRSGAPVLCDCQAVASMVTRPPAGNAVVCTVGAPEVPGIAARHGTTRSAAAVELWADRVGGAVVAIGNAPTALFHLLELIDGGWPRPAAILAFPVGFVGAAESKAELAARPRGVPFLTLRGRRGGSAMAAAAVNALARPEEGRA
jgi:precorrin-8X/cobalt-precorrin-8 methylmutase